MGRTGREDSAKRNNQRRWRMAREPGTSEARARRGFNRLVGKMMLREQKKNYKISRKFSTC